MTGIIASTTYAAQCCGCNQKLPPQQYASVAHDRAKEAGWVRGSDIICPACYEAREWLEDWCRDVEAYFDRHDGWRWNCSVGGERVEAKTLGALKHEVVVRMGEAERLVPAGKGEDDGE